ncbi:MAG: hypothetical protein ABIE55_00810 [Candidatus Aenigmatarchaeota archaeon]
MKDIPVKETLMFVLIVVGIVLVLYSFYTLAFLPIVALPLYRSAIFLATGLFSVYCALEGDNKRNLTILSVAFLFSVLYLIQGSFMTIILHGRIGPEYTWIYPVLFVNLVGLVITVPLYMMSKDRR